MDKYPWCGHSVLVGKVKNPLIPEIKASSHPDAQGQPQKPLATLAEKTVSEVLRHFGGDLNEARLRYRAFVEKGINQGRRPEFQGGGLVRSAGGDKTSLKRKEKEGRELSDPRILGTGDFVAEVIRNKSELDEKRRLQSVPLPNLLTNVSKHLGISEAEILSNSRKRDIGRARALISYAGVRVLKYPVFEVAKLLKISPPSVSKCIQRGEMMIGGDTEAIEKAIN